jgi:aminopeptidase N
VVGGGRGVSEAVERGFGEALFAELAYCGGYASAAEANGRKAFPLPGDPRVYGRDRTIRIEHLALELSFDLRRHRVAGVATTMFRPRQDGLREAVFDAFELEVESVEEQLADGETRALEYTVGDGELRIDLGRRRPASRPITTVVRYEAQPRRGLYFNEPEEDYPERPQQIWTQAQAEDAPYFFPVFDFPGEKFTSEVRAEVPLGWYALSNGRLEERRDDGRRRRSTFHWVQDRPHPAYLVTFAAGEFDEVETEAPETGVPVQYYAAKGRGEEAVRAFGRTPGMVDFFSDAIGVRYPWDKYATVAVAEFIFGGMENTSATTMTDTVLHDERAHPDLVDACDSLTAHELAHQWFGDLLTCREWSHGWLNESFATYFDTLWVEHEHGWDKFRYEVMRNGALYFQEDRASYRRPLVEPTYTEPLEIFDRHLYEKGSVVLDMLRSELGDEAWWAAINHYVTQHADGDVLTHDFQRAIEQATGRNVDWFFDQWVWKGGHPEFKAEYSWDSDAKQATVKLTQTQQPDDQLTSVYRTKLELGFQVRDRFVRQQVEVTDAAHAFVVPLAAEPTFVAIDPANRVLKSLDFSPGETQLKARLSDDPEAVGRIEAARQLAKVGSPKAIEALRDAMRNREELDYVRAEIATALGGVKGEAARDALISGRRDASPRVRRAIAAALGNFTDERAAGALRDYLDGGRANQSWGPGDRSYHVQGNAASALGKTRTAGARETLTALLERPSHNDVIAAGAINGLGATREPQALETLFEVTARGRSEQARGAACAALAALAPYVEAAQRTRIRERLEELLDDGMLRVRRAAIVGLRNLGDPAAVPALNALAARTLPGSAIKRQSRLAVRAIQERADRSEETTRLKGEVEQLQQANQQLSDRLTALEGRQARGGGRRGRGGRR